MMGVFISWKLANITNQSTFSPSEPVAKHLPALPCMCVVLDCMYKTNTNIQNIYIFIIFLAFSKNEVMLYKLFCIFKNYSVLYKGHLSMSVNIYIHTHTHRHIYTQYIHMCVSEVQIQKQATNSCTKDSVGLVYSQLFYFLT